MREYQEKNLLEQLQSADEHVKRRWLVAVTAVVMVAVVYVWLGYFNGIIAGTPQPASAPPTEVAGTSYTFWGTMKNGMAFMYALLGDRLHSLGQALQTPRDYIVKPPQ